MKFFIYYYTNIMEDRNVPCPFPSIIARYKETPTKYFTDVFIIAGNVVINTMEVETLT